MILNRKEIIGLFIVFGLISFAFKNLYSQNRNNPTISPASFLLGNKKAVANWIWDGGDINPKNYYLLIRKTILLEKSPDSAMAFISAYSFAEVYINGKIIDRCPMNCDPEFQVYEKYDIKNYFHKGINTIAALVYNFGIGMHNRINARGGFFFQGNIKFDDHSEFYINTDDSWLVKKADAWDTSSLLRTGYGPGAANLIGFTENFDARKMPEYWMGSDFNDLNWVHAKIIGIPPLSPWNHIVEVNRPPLARETILPLRHWFKSDQVIYDFGKELTASPAFELFAQVGGTKITIGTAERLFADSTAMTKLRLDYTDLYTCKKGYQQWNPLTWRGFRYLSISRSDNTIIKKVYALNRHFDLQQEGQFECSDPLLNEIWNVGNYTIKLCAQDTYIDTPWREQTQYIAGDTRFVEKYTYYAFGESSEFLTHYNILSAAWSQRWYQDGSIRTRYPTDWLLEENTSACLADYELEWVIMLGEYNQYFGHPEVITGVYTNMKKLLNHFESLVRGQHGLLWKVKGWIVLDHPGSTYPMDKREEITALNCLYYAALKQASFIAQHIAMDEPQAQKWLHQSQRLKQNIIKWLWSDKNQLYIDSYGSLKTSQQTQVYALLYDLVPEKSRKVVSDYIVSLERNCEQSFSYYLLSAVFDSHETWALNYIRKYWGAQMKLSTFNGSWHEAWEIEKIKSDGFTTSHAWCSGPTALLPQKVLGVEPVNDGWKKFSVNPHLCDLQWANGIVPTQYGSIEVNWKVEDTEKFTLYVKVPEHTESMIYIPGKEISINDKRIDNKNTLLEGYQYKAMEGEYYITSMLKN